MTAPTDPAIMAERLREAEARGRLTGLLVLALLRRRGVLPPPRKDRPTPA